MALLLIVILTLLPTSLGLAFHEHIPACKTGEIGYVVHLLANNQFYAFLSSEDPPSTDSVICNILPRHLVKILPLEQES